MVNICFKGEHMSTESDMKRLEGKIIKQSNGCWDYQGALDKDGYGIFHYERKWTYAHRTSYKMNVGDPTGKLVCHSCDNPSCVNPAHLFLGTNKDNMVDMVKKGRSMKGVPKSAEHNAKNAAAHLGKKRGPYKKRGT